MVSKVVENFLLVVDNSKNELESFKLVRYSDSPLVSKRMKLFRGCVVDVNVKRNPGLLGMNLLFGKHTVIGGVDLDRVREVGFPEDLLMTVKDGLPSIQIAWADEFDSLPIGVKEHPLFGEAFRTAYTLRDSTLELRERLKQLRLSDKQVKDLESQSKLEFFARFNEVIRSTQENIVAKGKVEADKNPNIDNTGMGWDYR